MGLFLDPPARRLSSKGDFKNGSDFSSLGEGGSGNFGEFGGEAESARELVRSFRSSEEHRETGESVLLESIFGLLAAVIENKISIINHALLSLIYS